MRVLRLLPSSLSCLLLASITLLTHPQLVWSNPISQPILHPTSGDSLIPGSAFTITWTPNPHFANITLELWDNTTWGYSRDFGELCYRWVNPFCGTIVSHAPNTGSFVWNIPRPGSDFPRGIEVFWIKMYVDDYQKPEINNLDPVLSYSERFAFELAPGMNPSAASGEVYSPVQSPSHSYTETGSYPVMTETVTGTGGVWPTVSNWKIGATSSSKAARPTAVPKKNETLEASAAEQSVEGRRGVVALLWWCISMFLMVL